jgi:hypothetical protein
MVPFLAQMMPGMEWIPFMILALIVGHLLWLIAHILRIHPGISSAGWKFSVAAVSTGVGSTLFFMAVIGKNLLPIGYFLTATPAIPGALTMFLNAKKRIDPRGFDVIMGQSRKSERGSG